MLTQFLHNSRHRLRSSRRLHSLLRAVGITASGRRLYEKRILAQGEMHAIVFGHRLHFAVESLREVRRIDSFSAEEDFVDEMVKTLRPGDVVWDVGANIGLISLVLAKSCDVTVHAFEPEPRNFAHLQRNIALNGLENRIFAHPVALGDREGDVDLFVGGETGDGRHSIIGSGMDGAHVTSVQVTTPSRAINQFASPPSVVKIDVEGFELAVLRGLASISPQCSTLRELFVEVHPQKLDTQGERAESLTLELTTAGYHRISSQKRNGELHQHFKKVSFETLAVSSDALMQKP
jgi:FkbM family methyltransferase